MHPTLTFLLKTLLWSLVNSNKFFNHERFFMIIVQQVLKRWNINLKLSEYVCRVFLFCFAFFLHELIFAKKRTSNILLALNLADFVILSVAVIFSYNIKKVVNSIKQTKWFDRFPLVFTETNFREIDQISQSLIPRKINSHKVDDRYYISVSPCTLSKWWNTLFFVIGFWLIAVGSSIKKSCI